MIKFNYVENIPRLYDTDDGWYITFTNDKFHVYFSEYNLYTQYNEYVLKETTDTLEEALEYIQSDEYVEVTPKSIRLRKIFLKEHERKKASNPALSN